jgi:hypothetical protein
MSGTVLSYLDVLIFKLPLWSYEFRDYYSYFTDELGKKCAVQVTCPALHRR